MREILGKAKTVRELLKGVQYSIDYYQREYKWQRKHIEALVNDLTSKFLDEYDPEHSRKKVADYPHYFLGSIIISKKESAAFVVDGQQRLTSLTLLLIKLRHMQEDLAEKVNVDELIYSEKYGDKSFNLFVEERIPCMEALFNGQPFDANGHSESIQNLCQRFSELDELFPEEIDNHALPYFIDWVLENVHLVEITAFSDDDAYTIFETMNDRGLSLSQTDMLKGYLLANIDDQSKRTQANNLWRESVKKLNETGKDGDADFFKAWLRSQYSLKIRERKRGAQPEDFDRIGTEFHRWLRDESSNIGLKKGDDYFRFIYRNFDFFSRIYLRVVDASRRLIPDLAPVFYNAQQGFTLQNLLLLAPLTPEDSEADIQKKLRIVARYVEILLTWRIWNQRTIAYSTLQYATFLTMRDIRSLDAAKLATALHEKLKAESENFATKQRFRMHQQNRYFVHRLLARMTDYVETSSGNPSRYTEFVAEGRNRYEVEHIWAEHPEQHMDEFSHSADFSEYRNGIGGLLLLPKSFNASYGDLEFEKKLPHYNTQNLLARSLHPQAYELNPGFLRFIETSGLPFHACEHFKKADLEERGELYRKLAEQIWNPESLLLEVNG